MKKIEFKDQELKVLKLICRQMTAKEIGDKLGLYKALAAMFDAFFGVNERVVNSLSA